MEPHCTLCATMVQLGRHQRLERLGDPHVLRVSPLIQLELLALDGIEPARVRRSSPPWARFGLGDRGLQLELGVVRVLPRQPVGGPLRVRRLDPLPGERKRAAGRAVERGELVGKQLPRGCAIGCQTRKARGSCCAAASAGANSVSSVAMRSLAPEPLARGAQLADDLQRRPRDRGRRRSTRRRAGSAHSVLQRRVHLLARQLVAAVERRRAR